MTPEEIKILNDCCRIAGVDASKISAENPMSKKGGTASLPQAAAAEFHPAQAAKWRLDAGGSLSVATLTEVHAGGELSDAAKSDMWLHDPDFVVNRQREQSMTVEKQLAWLDAETDKSRRAREGDQAVDFQNAKTAAQQEAKQESLRRHLEQQQRIAQRRNHADRMSGKWVNG